MSKKKSKEKVVEFSKLTNKVAAVWTRVSTERQADTNGSLESQRRICTEYAESHAIRIKKYYGGNDPWTASGVTWLKNKKNIKVYVLPGGSHTTRIGSFDTDTQEEIKTQINAWLNKE